MKFCVGSRVQQEIPEEGQRMHWLKCCDYNNKDEDNSLNTLNDKNILVTRVYFWDEALLLFSTHCRLWYSFWLLYSLAKRDWCKISPKHEWWDENSLIIRIKGYVILNSWKVTKYGKRIESIVAEILWV